MICRLVLLIHYYLPLNYYEVGEQEPHLKRLQLSNVELYAARVPVVNRSIMFV
jgi:hypothetical protein